MGHVSNVPVPARGHVGNVPHGPAYTTPPTCQSVALPQSPSLLTLDITKPAGVANESTAPREFKVQLLPAGIVKTVTYDNRRAEVTF